MTDNQSDSSSETMRRFRVALRLMKENISSLFPRGDPRGAASGARAGWIMAKLGGGRKLTTASYEQAMRGFFEFDRQFRESQMPSPDDDPVILAALAKVASVTPEEQDEADALIYYTGAGGKAFQT